jgi:sugar lactone lactonase YvrE
MLPGPGTTTARPVVSRAMEYTATNIAPGVFFGEGPRWHNGELWFSDFYCSAIKVLSPDVSVRIEHHFPGQPSGLGWLSDGRLVASSMLDRTVKVHTNGEWQLLADLSHIATFHTNDLVVGPNDDIYVGNFGFDLDGEVERRGFETVLGDHPTAALARIDKHGTVTTVATGLHFPNGMVITPDGKTLIVAETAAIQLSAFDINADGSLGEQRLWAKTPGLPDGICLDAEGCVWMAAAAMPACFRIREGGEIVDQVTTKYSCYACMLGGESGTDLYIMTAPAHDGNVARIEAKGWVAKATVNVPHAGLP